MSDSDKEEASSSKKIKVNAASLIDLKAEVAKRKDQFNKDKLNNVPRVRPQKTVIKNAGVEERNLRDLSETKLQEDELALSRKALERKAQLYEQLKSDSLKNDDEISPYLVDFEQKAINEYQELKKQEEEKKDSESDFSDVEEPKSPSEDWVEFTDALGRSRVCLRRDLPHYKRLDEKLKPEVEIESKPLEIPKPLKTDAHHERLKEKWAKNEEETKNAASVHYENIRFDEIRDHGIGFYRFSTDEQTRLEQRRMLDDLREKTLDQRKKSLLLRQKRKTIIKERLKRVRRRKRIRMGLDPDESDEEVSSDSDIDPLKIPVPKPSVQKEPEPVKEKTVREWDIGKTPLGLDQVWAKKKEILRSEREEEFAPPTFY